MKRELLQNVKILPYTSGTAVDREGFLSAIIGASVTTAGSLTITVTHCDTADGDFEAVTDAFVFPEKRTEGGKLTTGAIEAGGIANFDIDLSGLKNFVKVTVTGATALALALGDSRAQPV